MGIKQAINSPALQQFQGDGSHFVLCEALKYELEHKGIEKTIIQKIGKIIVVPEGFVTDFASVPPLARSIISVLGKHAVPAIVHDYLYWEQTCTRPEADSILFYAMDEYESNWFSRYAVWSALWAAGGAAWSTNKADREKGLPRVIPSEYLPVAANAIWSEYRQELYNNGVRATQ